VRLERAISAITYVASECRAELETHCANVEVGEGRDGRPCPRWSGAELPEGANAGSTFGLGDINDSIYFSPADSGPIIWGIGPSLTLPTATDENIGSEKWSAGPAAVALAQPRPG